jgi:hypothetical protein
MTNPTSNFGWQMPTPTDLVTDLPADFEVFGQAVDSDFADLLGGTTGQVLSKTSATDLDFTWSTPAGGGKVLQVIAAYTSTSTSNSTTTYADTTLTATITPSSATSKVLVLVSQNGVLKNTPNDYQGVDLALLRTTTVISTFAVAQGYTETNLKNLGSSSAGYLDSPSTTSATTYKTQFRCQQAEASVSVQYNSSNSSIILMEIGA